MISVDDAQKLIIQHSSRLGSEKLPLKQAFHHFLSNEIKSPIDQPPFDQSAMDGYAFRYDDLQNGQIRTFKLMDEVPAGQISTKPLAKEEAVRIFTGAALPEDANTVIMQEYVDADDTSLDFKQDVIKQGQHVRYKGEQIKKNETAALAHTFISSAVIGFLASLGIDTVDVFKQVNTAIIVTGDELQKEGELDAGKIYESNGLMLRSMLHELSLNSSQHNCHDDEQALTNMIKKQEASNDVILISGGVSVGDYDFTRKAVENNGYEIIFHGITQKPGKPILLAKKSDSYIVGLPGNPRSVWMCFYQYVYPLLMHINGAKHAFLVKLKAKLIHDFSKKNDGKTHFLSGHISESGVTVTGKQGSHILESLTESNCIIRINSDQSKLNAGTEIEVHLLPTLIS